METRGSNATGVEMLKVVRVGLDTCKNEREGMMYSLEMMALIIKKVVVEMKKLHISLSRGNGQD